MSVNLKGKSFLTLKDFDAGQIRYLLDLAKDLKAKKRMNVHSQVLKNKNIVLLFEKTSTRTRCAFEVAAKEEGGNVTFLDPGSSQMGKKESLKDTAKVLGRFYDAIEYRGYDQKIVEDLAKYSGVPVFNGLTDADHPTQILADMLTMEEHINKPLNKCKVTFVGDVRNNMSYAWMYGCAKMGIDFVSYGPRELIAQVDNTIIKSCEEDAQKSGATIKFTDDIEDIKGSDVIYSDIWASMGEEDLIKERAQMLAPYRIDCDFMKKTENPDVLFLHCLPSFHDFETVTAKNWQEKGVDIREVTDEVFYGPNSVVFDEAENRMHTIKAVMVATI